MKILKIGGRRVECTPRDVPQFSRKAKICEELLRPSSIFTLPGPFSTINYLYDGFQAIAEVDQSGSALARYTQNRGIDEPLARFSSGTTSYYEQDALNS